MQRTTGIIMIIIGALMMIYTGFSFITEKKVVDLGPLEVNKEERHPVQWSPIVGAILLVGGIAIVASGKNSKTA
jgi:hypothetical protein